MLGECDFTDFFNAYVEAALWSSTDGDGTPLDRGDHELSIVTRQRMEADCRAFLTEPVQIAIESAGSELPAGRTGVYSSAGHDFWLTRNGHGAGFWDGDWPEPHAAMLDQASKAAGPFDLYVGDDGLIYG